MEKGQEQWECKKEGQNVLNNKNSGSYFFQMFFYIKYIIFSRLDCANNVFASLCLWIFVLCLLFYFGGIEHSPAAAASRGDVKRGAKPIRNRAALGWERKTKG